MEPIEIFESDFGLPFKSYDYWDVVREATDVARRRTHTPGYRNRGWRKWKVREFFIKMAALLDPVGTPWVQPLDEGVARVWSNFTTAVGKSSSPRSDGAGEGRE